MKMDISNIYCKIFDYGIPVEDIFPPNGVHPRLKLLFARAYQAAKEYEFNITDILNVSGTLSERMNLKELLVSEHWQYIGFKDFPPGAFFWVIRQFLGLLPLPLLPKYSNGILLDWEAYAEIFNCTFESKNRVKFEVVIIENLSKLPPANLLMLDLLVRFIRKVSQKNNVLLKSSLKCLSKYFCAVIFTRPFLPGYRNSNKMLPFFNFLIIRWRNISEKARIQNIANHIDWNVVKNENNKAMTDFFMRNFAKESSFIVDLPKIVPCIITNNNLKENSSQTHTYESISKNSKSSQTESSKASSKTIVSSAEYNNVFYLNGTNTYEIIKQDRQGDTDAKTNLSKIDELEESKSVTLYNTALNITDTSESDAKIDGFIYDDYETFKNEDFNQITVPKQTQNKISKISKFGWTYTSPKKNPTKQITSSTPRAEEENSYVKFPDVFDEENGVAFDESISKVTSHSPDVKTKKKLKFKSKISLDFIRKLMPKRSCNMDESNIKYKKFSRSNTL